MAIIPKKDQPTVEQIINLLRAQPNGTYLFNHITSTTLPHALHRTFITIDSGDILVTIKASHDLIRRINNRYKTVAMQTSILDIFDHDCSYLRGPYKQDPADQDDEEDLDLEQISKYAMGLHPAEWRRLCDCIFDNESYLSNTKVYTRLDSLCLLDRRTWKLIPVNKSTEPQGAQDFSDLLDL